MKSLKYCLVSFLVLGNVLTTPIVSADENDFRETGTEQQNNQEAVKNQSKKEQLIEDTKNQTQDQVGSSSRAPRFSVGQTVNLMDQNTKKTWNITIEKDFYQVNQYLGRYGDTNVVIPTEMNIVLMGTTPTKKKVRLNGGSTKFMQNATGNPITSFKVEGNNEVLVNGVEGINQLFRNSSIENVDLTGLNVNVISDINMSNMFQGCSRLKNIKFGTTNFNNVTNASRMFSGCASLQSVDLSMWNTNKRSLDMSYMFENTPNLREIDLRNMSLDSQNTSRILGDRSTNKTAVGQPLAVVVNPATSSKFLNFDFVNESGRVPEAFPILDANGGVFSSGGSILKYVDKICVTPEQLKISNFNAWKENNKPSKDGYSFTQWCPSRNEDSPSSVFNLLNITYQAQWDNSVQEATNKANALFNGENLAAGVTQEKINDAQAAVDKVKDAATKQALQEKIKKAQSLFDAQNEQNQLVQEATNKVNALFNGENLAAGVTQEKINDAQAAVDKVKDAATKQALQEKIKKAQQLLDSVFEITSVDPYITGVSQFVTGAYKGKGAAHIRVIVNGEKKTLVPMTDNGTIKYYIPGLKVTDKVSVVIYDKQYKQLAEQAVPVKEAETVKVTKIDPYLEGKSKYVRGEYTGNGVAHIRVVVNGEKKTLVPMKDTGKFEYYIPGLKATDNVSVELYNSTWEKVAESKVNVDAPAKIKSIDPYIADVSQFVTGTYTGKGAAYIRVVVNGEKKTLVPMADEGTIKYYIPGLKVTDKVSVVIYDNQYQQLSEKEVSIEKAEAVKITKIDPYLEGKSQSVQGEYTGNDVAYIRVVVNGEKKTLVPLKDSGELKYYIPRLKSTDKVFVELYNSAWKKVAESKVTIE